MDDETMYLVIKGMIRRELEKEGITPRARLEVVGTSTRPVNKPSLSLIERRRRERMERQEEQIASSR
jgi:hypothetical protein